LELANKTFYQRVIVLWEGYWRMFDEVEQLRRSNKSDQDARELRANYAKSRLGAFIQLERDSQNLELESASVLLFHKVGCCLYGELNDDVSALKHLRAILSQSPDDGALVPEQIHAIKLSLRAYGKSHAELAKTLSVIKVNNNSARKMRELRRVIVGAVELVCSNDTDAPIHNELFAELCRVCILKCDTHGQHTFADFIKGIGELHGKSL